MVGINRPQEQAEARTSSVWIASSRARMVFLAVWISACMCSSASLTCAMRSLSSRTCSCDSKSCVTKLLFLSGANLLPHQDETKYKHSEWKEHLARSRICDLQPLCDSVGSVGWLTWARSRVSQGPTYYQWYVVIPQLEPPDVLVFFQAVGMVAR